MLDIALGYILDLLAGDPYWFPHPVRLIGSFISFMEKLLRKVAKTATAQKIAGIILTVVTVGLTYAVSYLLLAFVHTWNAIAFHVLNIVIIYTTLATRSLGGESMKIYKLLKDGDADGARHALSYIVSRDTHKLDVPHIVRATVETVAENTSDGVIAPLFYLFIGGAPLAMAYKAVNTLDSMVGYKNERYLHFGWASARLDDIANFLPARIAAVLISVAAAFFGGNFKRAFSTMLKEGSHHESPNSGYPEAAMAGALGVTLGGPSTYGGKVVKKPILGQPINALEPTCIKQAVHIMAAASLFAFVIGELILWIV